MFLRRCIQYNINEIPIKIQDVLTFSSSPTIGWLFTVCVLCACVRARFFKCFFILLHLPTNRYGQSHFYFGRCWFSFFFFFIYTFFTTFRRFAYGSMYSFLHHRCFWIRYWDDVWVCSMIFFCFCSFFLIFFLFCLIGRYEKHSIHFYSDSLFSFSALNLLFLYWRTRFLF